MVTNAVLPSGAQSRLEWPLPPGGKTAYVAKFGSVSTLM
jgi:hypothetical protein